MAFALCVTATDCRDPEIALFPEQDQRAADVQFSLHQDTLDLFRTWAKFNGYDANEKFVTFLEKLPEALVEGNGNRAEMDVEAEPSVERQPIESRMEKQPVEHDFDVVSRIIADRTYRKSHSS